MHCPGSQPAHPGCIQQGWGARCLLWCGPHMNLGCLWMLKAVTGCYPKIWERQQDHCTQRSPRSEGSGTFEASLLVSFSRRGELSKKAGEGGVSTAAQKALERKAGPARLSQHTQRGWLPRHLHRCVFKIILKLKKKKFNVLNASLKQPKIFPPKRENL